MEVILRIIEGPEKRREFRFKEADNLLVGRKDPSSRAHVNVSPDDVYVSRHHFTVEVRPPNCLIRDNGSANGTFVARSGRQHWERIQEAPVGDGDRIRIGHTILSVEIRRDEAIATRPYEDVSRSDATVPLRGARARSAPESEAPALACIRCGASVGPGPIPEQGTLGELDFMCSRCRGQCELERRRAAAGIPVEARCRGCGVCVAERANTDGRAAELADVALYLCRSCAERSATAPPRLLGGYRILRELGRGGMGVVYQGWHPLTGRLAALKQILPRVGMDRPTTLRFLRESTVLGALRHPGLVRLYETGEHDGAPFTVSEFVPDGGLEQHVSEEGRPLLPPRSAALLIADALVGLDFMHEKGYVHRDIKPANVLQRRDGGTLLPKVSDFGLARSYEEHGGTQTRTGEFCGTFMYMPPEQILEFKRVRPVTDVYAMGVSLYYLLSGRYPLNMPPPAALRRGARVDKDPLRMVLEDPPMPLRARRGDLPAALCAAVDRACAKEKERRPASARELREELLRAVAAS